MKYAWFLLLSCVIGFTIVSAVYEHDEHKPIAIGFAGKSSGGKCCVTTGIAYNNFHSTIVPLPNSCKAKDGGALPDPKCTPGAYNHAVTQKTIKKTICVPGYSASIRPPESYTEPLKEKLMKAYGYTDSLRNYELDHLVPIELGGDPTSVKNLFPEPHNIIFGNKQEGSYTKDGLENAYHAAVCNGTMTLAMARRAMAKGGWLTG